MLISQQHLIWLANRCSLLLPALHGHSPTALSGLELCTTSFEGSACFYPAQVTAQVTVTDTDWNLNLKYRVGRVMEWLSFANPPSPWRVAI